MIAEDTDPLSDTSVNLRDGLARLIWDSRSDERGWSEPHSRYGYIVPALALLCGRQLADGRATTETESLIWCSVVAIRFGACHTAEKDSIEAVKQQLHEKPSRREAAFWKNLDLMDAAIPSEKDWDRWFRVQYKGVIEELGEPDRPWLEAALFDASVPHRRSIALQALAGLWIRRGCSAAEAEPVRVAVEDDPHLTEELTKRTAPPRPNPKMERMERHSHRRRCIEEARDHKRLDEWRKWREGLCADPETAFGEDRRDATVGNLSDRPRARSKSSTRYGCWDEAALKEVFGERVTEHAIDAFRAFWRTQRPEMWSRRLPEKRNRVSWGWITGLHGLSAEASMPGWAKGSGD